MLEHDCGDPRRLPRRSLVGGVVALATLAACGKVKGGSTTASPTVSGPPSVGPAGSATPSTSTTPSSSASATTITSLDAIKVAGAKGKLPAVTATWPLQIAETQSKVLIAGTGPVVPAAAIVEVSYLGVNARTGKTFDQSFSTGKPVAFGLAEVVKGFAKGLTGKRVGDRVLVMMPSKDGYANGNPQAGIQKGDSLVFVVDLVATSFATATGVPQPPKPGLPVVKDNGADKPPTITIGSATKPSQTVSEVLIKGPGRAVTAQDLLQVHYSVVNFDTGAEIAQTYTTGADQGALNTLILAWQKSLVGKTVGSRVLIVAAPADAYPKGNQKPSVPAGATLVYVVDLLFASAQG